MTKKSTLTQKCKFDHNHFVLELLADLGWTDLKKSEIPKLLEVLGGGADTQTISPRCFAAFRQIEALFSKNVSVDGNDSKSRRASALRTFAHSERMCRVTNKRLAYYREHWTRRPKIWGILERARSDIQALLGPLSAKRLRLLFEDAGFGNGSTFSCGTPYGKSLLYKVEFGTITPDCLPYFELAKKTTFLRWNMVPEVVPGNRIAFVPKSASTERTIAVEPSINVFLQKGVDAYIKRRLLRWGVTLHDQDRNSELLYAQEGYSTIDLKSASDSLSLELVRLLLPDDWFIYLDDLRSKKYFLNGKWEVYDKFSSMGNATTFPLESLIFASLCRAVLSSVGDEREFRVYGDDIIISPQSALLLIEVLKFVGFSCNPSKTYVFGEFKESCGVDIYKGVDVRPVYVKKWPKTNQELYNLHNRLWCNRFGFVFTRACRYLRKIAPFKCFGPVDIGSNGKAWYAGKATIFDGYFFGEPPRLCSLSSKATGYKSVVLGCRYASLTPNSEEALLLACLIGAKSDSFVDPRKVRYYIKRVEYPSWIFYPNGAVPSLRAL